MAVIEYNGGFVPPDVAEQAALLVTRLRKLLWVLIASVILEGLLRKLAGPQIGNLLFIGKDALVLLMGLLMLFYRFDGTAATLHAAYGTFFFFMLVPFALTLNRDVVLALFGFKQYVLFPCVAFAFYVAFRDASRAEVLKFFKTPALLLIPVTVLALIQLRLPASNALNLSVGGTEMGGFMAAGKLRVASTFPFVAQFAMYLNAMIYILGVFFFVRPKQAGVSIYMSITICGLLVLSSFVTGSRTAVLGDASILAVAGGLLMMRGNAKASGLLLGAVLVSGVAYYVASYYMPEAFQAYKSRSLGTKDLSAEDEVKGRVDRALYEWMDGLEGAPPTYFGYGLGVMSNGSKLLSAYASSWRGKGTWGEVDMANTLFEGGWYLVYIWMAFRLFTIWFVFQRVMGLRDPRLVTAGCLAAAYVAIEGIMGALGIQPPLAIWFWLAVGTVLVLEQLDRRPETEPPAAVARPSNPPSRMEIRNAPTPAKLPEKRAGRRSRPAPPPRRTGMPRF